MTVTIDGIEFANVRYDGPVDVLYLWSGQPRKPAHDDASPEGHYLQFGADGALASPRLLLATRAVFSWRVDHPRRLGDELAAALRAGSQAGLRASTRAQSSHTDGGTRPRRMPR